MINNFIIKRQKDYNPFLCILKDNYTVNIKYFKYKCLYCLKRIKDYDILLENFSKKGKLKAHEK